MRTPTNTAATTALLNSAVDFAMADLYTITLIGGTVLRWTSAQMPLTFGGNTFALGPLLTRGNISHKVGTAVSTLDVDLGASATDLINGVPLIPFIRASGLDGATLMLERAFLPDWASPITGTVIDFLGFVTSIKGITAAGLSLTVSSAMVRLNVSMGPDLYQAPCLNVLFDTNCGLLKATYQVSGATTGTPTASAFNTGLTQANGYFTQGVIKFTSGANSGVQRTIRSHVNASGAVAVSFPFPSAPAAADTFLIWPGCDHTLATCKAKFLADNSIHYRGQPFIPVAETAI